MQVVKASSYVQQSLENGAQFYIAKDERSGILNISSFRKQDHHEASTHSLRFEAYELPKPTVPMPSRAPPVSLASSTELVPIPEPSYPREMHQTTAVPSVSDTGPSELKLSFLAAPDTTVEPGIGCLWQENVRFSTTTALPSHVVITMIIYW